MDPSSRRNKILFWTVVIDLVVLNVGLAWLIRSQRNAANREPTNQLTTYVDRCGDECKSYIDSRLAKPSPTPMPTPTPLRPAGFAGQALSPKTKVRTVSYVTVPGNGSTSSNDWTTLSGTDFYFNTADYPGLVEVYFEANIKLFNGNGKAYVRLFDVTHGIGVQGGDVGTSSQTSTAVESGRVTFWAGKNLIRVQAKSLTADTAVYDFGRLRVVTEN